MPGKVLIGVSGRRHPPWRGRIYPRKRRSPARTVFAFMAALERRRRGPSNRPQACSPALG